MKINKKQNKNCKQISLGSQGSDCEGECDEVEGERQVVGGDKAA